MSAANSRLYDLLGVSKDASPSDIKKAYHRLALQCHPDKAGEEGAGQFKVVKQAYDILSDPSKRALYDKLGERGIEMAENPMANSFMETMGYHYAIIILMVVMMYIVTMLILFLSFLAARIDGRNHWTFAKVFSPIFVLDATGFLAILPSVTILFQATSEDGEVPPEEQRKRTTRKQKVMLVLLYIILGSLLVFSILVPVGLDRSDSTEASWRCYFIPLFVAEVTATSVFFWHSSSPALYVALLQRAAGVTVSQEYATALWAVEILGTACRLPFWVLIACRIDNVIQVSWFVVGIPLYFGLVLIEIGIALLAFAQARAPDAPRGSAAVPIVMFGLSMAVLLLSALLVFAKLDGASISLANALIPVFVAVSVAFMGSCCGFCAACATAPIPQGDLNSGPDEPQDATSREQQSAPNDHVPQPDQMQFSETNADVETSLA